MKHMHTHSSSFFFLSLSLSFTRTYIQLPSLQFTAYWSDNVPFELPLSQSEDVGDFNSFKFKLMFIQLVWRKKNAACTAPEGVVALPPI